LRAAEISPTRLNQILTVKADRHILVAAIVLKGIARMVEIVAGAVDVPEAEVAIVDAGDAADGLVAVDAIVVDAAGLAGDDTKTFATDLYGFLRTPKRPRRESWPFNFLVYD
jgi:hypothetical protein